MHGYPPPPTAAATTVKHNKKDFFNRFQGQHDPHQHQTMGQPTNAEIKFPFNTRPEMQKARSWRRSEYGFVPFVHSQEFSLLKFCLPPTIHSHQILTDIRPNELPSRYAPQGCLGLMSAAHVMSTAQLMSTVHLVITLRAQTEYPPGDDP